jgi:hypothetical protein
VSGYLKEIRYERVYWTDPGQPKEQWRNDVKIIAFANHEDFLDKLNNYVLLEDCD